MNLIINPIILPDFFPNSKANPRVPGMITERGKGRKIVVETVFISKTKFI